MGRPFLDIDEEKVAELASQGARNSEIAAILGIDDQTLTANYSRLLDKKRAERRLQLRISQTVKAMDGDTTMLIWLGKNELGQTDKQEITADVIEVRRVHKGIDGRSSRTPSGTGDGESGG